MVGRACLAKSVVAKLTEVEAYTPAYRKSVLAVLVELEAYVASLAKREACSLACHNLILVVLAEPEALEALEASVASSAKLVELVAWGGTLASCMEASALVQGRVPSLDSWLVELQSSWQE